MFDWFKGFAGTSPTPNSPEMSPDMERGLIESAKMYGGKELSPEIQKKYGVNQYGLNPDEQREMSAIESARYYGGKELSPEIQNKYGIYKQGQEVAKNMLGDGSSLYWDGTRWNRIGGSVPAPPEPIKEEQPKTPSQLGVAESAQYYERDVQRAREEARRYYADVMKRIADQPNPYDINSEAFKAALAGAANRISSQMGQREGMDTRSLASQGMLGSSKAGLIKMNTELAARKAQALAREGLYADAMRSGTAFEQKRQSDLAAIANQAFNADILGIERQSTMTDKALMSPMAREAAAIELEKKRIDLQDIQSNTEVRRSLANAEGKQKLDSINAMIKLGVPAQQAEALFNSLQRKAREDKLEIGQVETFLAQNPYFLRAERDAKEFASQLLAALGGVAKQAIAAKAGG